MTKAYEALHQQYDSVVERNVRAPIGDGAMLAADTYFPAVDGRRADGAFPVILERTPYQKSTPRQANKGRYFTQCSYVCVIQDVRGHFESEGELCAFAREAPGGYDTAGWLAAQPCALPRSLYHVPRAMLVRQAGRLGR